jgi:hypothetical protein
MNMKLLTNPNWREHSPEKWKSKKDFLAKITYRDKSWNKALIFDEKYPDPFLQT